MALEFEELKPILDEVQSKIFLANQDGSLPELLSSLGLGHLLSTGDDYGVQNNPRGDIVVLGGLAANAELLRMAAGKKGISKMRIKFRDYDSVKSVNSLDLKTSYSVAVILCGPLPHKGKDMGDSSSLIQSLHDAPGSTPVRDVREMTGELKVTKTSFNKVLDDLLAEGILECA